jgi:hypothetical protein
MTFEDADIAAVRKEEEHPGKIRPQISPADFHRIKAALRKAIAVADVGILDRAIRGLSPPLGEAQTQSLHRLYWDGVNRLHKH